MSRTPEQRLWDRMSKALRAYRRLKLERYENAVGVGCPDVLAICNGIVTWCEQKQVEEPPVGDKTRLIPSGKGLSRDQRNWHVDWRQHGGRSVIVVGLGTDEVFFISNEFADEVNDFTLAQMREKTLAKNWREFATYLGFKHK